MILWQLKFSELSFCWKSKKTCRSEKSRTILFITCILFYCQTLKKCLKPHSHSKKVEICPCSSWIVPYMASLKGHNMSDLMAFPPVVHVASGVPQGSVLGPLSFTVCVNKLTQNVPSAQLFMLKILSFTAVKPHLINRCSICSLLCYHRIMVFWSETWMLHKLNWCCFLMLGRH